MATAGVISSDWKNSGSVLSDDPCAMTDEGLVAVAQGGDAAAFDELCKRHTQKIFRTAHRIMRHREDAEDAVQECFLNAFIHLRSFDGRSRFSTWLTRIAINVALMKLRKNRGYREVPAENPVETSELRPEHQLADPSPNPEERYATTERQAALRDAIARLRPAIRKVIEIQLQECCVAETAEILGISVSAVKARLFHARAALRQRSQLHLMVPSIWTSSEPSSRAVRRVSRRGRKQAERSLEVGVQAKGISLEANTTF